jgi:hypothetical protein
MTLPRTSPLRLEALKAIPAETILEQLRDLTANIRHAEQDLMPWLKKQQWLSELRYGHLPKRKLPWRGAANISTDLIDSIIRRWKPGIASLMLDANPIATLTPWEQSDFEAQFKAEQFLTGLFASMEPDAEAIYLADQVAHHGFALTREGWDYRTRRQARVVPSKDLFGEDIQEFVQQAITQAAQQGEELTAEDVVIEVLEQQYRLDSDDPEEGAMLEEAASRLLSGAEYVRLTSVTIDRDRPAWRAASAIDFIAPMDQNPEDAEFAVFLHDFSPDEVKARVQAGEWEPEAARIALSKASEDREGTLSTTNLRDEIKDFLNRRQRKGNLQRRGCVLWIAPDAPGGEEDVSAVLALYEYPFPFQAWPFTVYKFSGDALRPWDSRGISEMLASHQRVTNEFQNARLNASQILLSPVFKQKTRDLGETTAINWRPGGTIKVRAMDDIEPVVHDLRILAELIREEQVTQRQAETYIGVFDATLTNLQQSRERRTAAEVNAIQGISASIFNLDARLFQDSFSRSLGKIWNLYLEWGPNEMWLRLMSEPLPMQFLKDEIGRNFDLRASGTPSNTNRALQMGNVSQMLQLMLNPAVFQSGQFNLGELVKYWISLIDAKLATRVVRPDEEAAAIQQIQRAAALGAEQLGEEPAPLL